MKKTLYTLALAAMTFAAVSCQKKDIEGGIRTDEPSTDGGLVFRATIESVDEGATRTILEKGLYRYKVCWEETDSISINGVIYKAEPDAENPAKATFTKMRENDPDPEKVAGNYFAYYPAAMYDSLTKACTSLPAVQSYGRDSSVAGILPMYGIGTSTGEINFKNCCGLLKFTLKGTETVKNIVVRDEEKGLSGKITGINMDGTLYLSSNAKDGVTLDLGENGITLNEGEGVTFYVALPVETYNKLHIEYNTTGTKFAYLKAKENLTIERNKVYSYDPFAPVFREDWFYFEAVDASSTVKMLSSGSNPPEVNLEYTEDYGETWKDFVVGATGEITIPNAGDKVFFRAKTTNDAFGNKDNGRNIFQTAAGKVNMGGNIMYLLNGQNPGTAIEKEYAFASLFKACKIVSASKLKLPATTLSENCYYEMFKNCDKLEGAPVLPAKTLAEGCYNSMFTSCSSLTEAPELPAKTLVKQCYCMMFFDCSKLNYIKCLATDISADKCLTFWVGSSTPAAGKFVKAAGMTKFGGGMNGVPAGWEVLNEYIDENGIDCGTGIKVAGLEWAPVNCGYDSTDYPYGKLYQWGRKVGQGYKDDTYEDADYPNKPGSASVIAAMWEGPNGAEAPLTFYEWGNGSTYNVDWIRYGSKTYWNTGSGDAPVKTEYDPCPAGWRVPTADEFGNLVYSDWNPSKQEGNTPRAYSFDGGCGTINGLSFLAAGQRNFSCDAQYRGTKGYYWSSAVTVDGSGSSACCLRFTSTKADMTTNGKANAQSVRCVKATEPDGTNDMIIDDVIKF